MKALIESLKNETAELKALYLEKTKEWAETEVTSLLEQYAWSYQMWVDSYPVKCNGSYTLSKAGSNRRGLSADVKRDNGANFIEKALKSAETHYNDSIVKLASRIEKKELNQNSLSLISSRLGMNFETIISDGEKKVRAFTILAWGAIQRPHYRYLVK